MLAGAHTCLGSLQSSTCLLGGLGGSGVDRGGESRQVALAPAPPQRGLARDNPPMSGRHARILGFLASSWPACQGNDLTEVGKELALLECLLRARHESRCSLGNTCVGWTRLAPCTDEETCSWRQSHLPRTPLLTSSLTPLVTLSPTTFVIPLGMGSEAFK